MKINQFSFNIKRSNSSVISKILEFWLNEIASREVSECGCGYPEIQRREYCHNPHDGMNLFNLTGYGC